MNDFFNSADKAILNYMYRANRWVSTGKVAAGAGIARATARLHLESLSGRGYVISFKKGNVLYWKLGNRDDREVARRKLEKLSL
jgi:DNA-binding IclR family transcriptional regulator